MSELDLTTINVIEAREMTEGEFKSGDKIEKEYPFLEDYIVDQRTKLRETLEICLNNFKNGIDHFDIVYTLPNKQGLRIKKKYHVVCVSKNLESQFDAKHQRLNEDTGKYETTGIRTFIKEKITGIHAIARENGVISEYYYDTYDFENMDDELLERYSKEEQEKVIKSINLMSRLTRVVKNKIRGSISDTILP